MGAGDRIKGLTIVLSADSSDLIKSIKSVNEAMRNTQSNLRDINRALKFDPKNTELLKDKQNELTKAISDTKLKIAEEEKAMQALKDAGVDETSQQFRDLKTQIDIDKSSLEGFENQLKTFGSVGAQVMQQVGREIKAVGDKMKGVGDKIADIGTNLTTKVTVPIVAAGGTMVAKYAEVDKTMTLANKTMNNTAQEAEHLNKAMEQAAANSTFGMNDAANAALNFARAGLDAEQAANAIAPAMNLAAGEAGDLDTVSGGLVATINGFGDGFEQAEHYADVFAQACNSSALDVNTLSESMSVAAPIFNTAGKSVEDAALMLGVMANAGIDANVAANSLKTGMARLAEPTKQAREAMEKYGISMDQIWNEDGSMKDMTVIQQELNRSFSQLSEQEQMAAAGAIFGKNQMAAWLAVINTAPADVQELNDKLSETDGVTREMADAMMGGFGGSIEKLKSSLDVLMTSLGQIIAQYLTPVIEKVQAIVDKFMALDDETKNHIVQIAAVAAAVGPVLVIIGKVVTVIGSVVSAVGTITTAIGTVMPVLTSIAGTITGVVIPAITAVSAPVLAIVAVVTAAVAGIVAAINHLWETDDEFRSGVIQVIADIVAAIKDFIHGFQPMIEQIKQIINLAKEFVQTAISTLLNKLKNWMNEHKNFINMTLSSIKYTVLSVLEIIKGIVKTTLDVIKGLFKTTLDLITGILKTATALMKGDWSGALNAIKTTAKNILNDVMSLFKNLKNDLGGVFKSLVSNFKSWGKDMIDGLVDGIKSKISAVKDTISDVADTIASFIHFSEPDVGPLSNASSFMPDFMKLLSQGIRQGIPQIESAMQAMTNSMVPAIGESSYAGATGTTNNTANNTISINVYGAQGQDVYELADIIQDRINQATYSNKAVFQ